MTGKTQAQYRSWELLGALWLDTEMIRKITSNSSRFVERTDTPETKGWYQESDSSNSQFGDYFSFIKRKHVAQPVYIGAFKTEQYFKKVL